MALQNILLESKDGMLNNSKHHLRRALSQPLIARKQQWMSGWTEMRHNIGRSSLKPDQTDHRQDQATAPALLEERGPQAKHEDDERNFFFTHHRQNSKDKEPERAARIHKIEREKQQSGCKRHRVE